MVVSSDACIGIQLKDATVCIYINGVSPRAFEG
jgi:hypothetical protein